ncbi:pyridoxal phosphate-dependent aminotransferase [Shewanella sp. C32]|uniref:Aminotransferase n=1 Tax=Shewanella electrica TaxID=515560 RepID=A0ABT2FL67_9GAMM|nr:pyridoxal phosphate-dependent aminotransferase [Shewanella electrica]MCH1923856.1 pyridoxal phosphate-dependent aminotransferase [Shewanella electrica]MCS4557075.1 pyridoxal phosphate-dependent aminotransferase [Shewanella electrica]
MKVAQRTQQIEPFYAMELAKHALEIERQLTPEQPPMIHLSLGEPDFTAPELVQQAAISAIAAGDTKYTSALGLMPLREHISQWYQQRFGLAIAPERIIVTAGASAALQLVCMALVEPGDEVLMPDPCYPCNRHFVSSVGGRATLIPTAAADRFQLTHAKVAEHWQAASRGVLIASPSNPTGTSIPATELRNIHAFVKQQGGFTIIDELYLGLSYDQAFGQSALAIDDDIISINSFSKYFSMTGWRVGWMVVPETLVPTIEKLAQNFFICPSAIAQQAAIACFQPQSIDEYEQRRLEYLRRRDWFIPALNALGLTVPVMPDGAFYAWANCQQWCEAMNLPSSWEFAFELMQRCHIAVTPGRDFGTAGTEHYVRFSTANSLENLQQAVERLAKLKASLAF